tara:strand:- start:1808 stop:2749 length:942 start_codon:yes stop_codon:yes gene_type:complete
MNYLNSGVNIENGNNFVSVIKNITNNKNIGGFSGVYEYNGIKLVASTDGVGTKLLLCKKLNKYDTIGIDLVAMCVNDIICQGAKPLFFLDYYSTGKLDTTIGSNIIQGIHNGCLESGCILLGGETAEMPSLYNNDHFDLAGFSVGIIEEDVYPKKMDEGDLIYSFPSSGVHSNGYSLINKLLDTHDYDLNELMKPTTIYVKDIHLLKQKYKHKIKGFSHITGGGIIDNIPRIINEGYSMNISEQWDVPDVFQWIYNNSDMTVKDMLSTYNCGLGMVVIFEKNTEVTDDLIYLGQIIQSDEYQIHYETIEKSFI